MIHPAFEPLRRKDTYAAEAFSEIISDSVTAVTQGEAGAGFPAHPTELGAVFASYLKPKDDSYEVKQQYAVLEPNLIPPIKLGKMYKDLAGEVVHQSRTAFQNIDGFPDINVNDLVQRSCIEMVLAENKRLLVAYAAGKIARTGEFTDAIIYPKKIMRELPLQYREIAESAVLDDDAKGGDVSDEDRSKLEILLTQHPMVRNLGLLAVATFLPTPKQFMDRFTKRP